LKYINVTKIVIAQMIGNVEDEWCFLILSFVKSKLCNKLIDHLYLVMHMFAQKFFTLESFTYHEALLILLGKKKEMVCL
jgi:hypothetical protein